MLIDFDNPLSFPEELSRWNDAFEKYIRGKVSLDGISENWEISHQLQDLRLSECSMVKQFVIEHPDAEIAVCHCTRVLDVNQIKAQGLVTNGGESSDEEKRIRLLFDLIQLDKEKQEDILTHVHALWNRDKEQRTKSVHFFVTSDWVYEDDRLNNFAINIGGEIVRWAIEAAGKELWKMEPYKCLWIWGQPSVVKFKVRLSDIPESLREMLIAEIFIYYIAQKLFGYEYEIRATGMTIGNVPPEDIISIDEIKDFIAMQEKYSKFEGFYDELK